MIAPTSILAPPTNLHRLAVTIAALAAYAVAQHIPLYGIDRDTLGAFIAGPNSNSVFARLSIAGLGVTPIFAALCLAELVRIVGPRAWTVHNNSTGPVPNAVLWLALVFAVVQSANIAMALEEVQGARNPLVASPGLEFRLGCVASMVTTTALLWWLSMQITRHGLGSGFWLLFIAPPIAGLVALSGKVADLLSTGAVTIPSLSILLGYVVLAVLAVVFLYGRLTSSDRAGVLLWPALLAPVCINALLLLVLAASHAFNVDWIHPAQAVLTPGLPLWIMIEALLIGSLVFLRNRRSSDPLSLERCALIAIVLMAIVAIGYTFNASMPWIATNGGIIIATTVVMLKLLEAARPGQRA